MLSFPWFFRDNRPADKPTAKNDSDKLFADDEDDNDLFAAPPPLPKDESKVCSFLYSNYIFEQQ